MAHCQGRQEWNRWKPQIVPIRCHQGDGLRRSC